MQNTDVNRYSYILAMLKTSTAVTFLTIIFKVLSEMPHSSVLECVEFGNILTGTAGKELESNGRTFKG